MGIRSIRRLSRPAGTSHRTCRNAAFDRVGARVWITRPSASCSTRCQLRPGAFEIGGAHAGDGRADAAGDGARPPETRVPRTPAARRWPGSQPPPAQPLSTAPQRPSEWRRYWAATRARYPGPAVRPESGERKSAARHVPRICSDRPAWPDHARHLGDALGRIQERRRITSAMTAASELSGRMESLCTPD